MKKRIARNRKKDTQRKQGRKNRSLFAKKGMHSGTLSSKADARFIIELIGKTFRLNKATIEARKMNESISRYDAPNDEN